MTRSLDSTEWIQTRADFVEFMEMICGDFRKNYSEWENSKLEGYLEALHAYSNDVDGYYKNMNQENLNIPTWKLFADIIIGAKIYE
jgi:hypothetical protein